MGWLQAWVSGASVFGEYDAPIQRGAALFLSQHPMVCSKFFLPLIQAHTAAKAVEAA
jgi:hypothetical protein